MEKEFIPYKEALALKELGFSSPYPIGGYQGGSVFYYEKGNLYYDGRPMYSSDAHTGQIDAPLYQQAFRWFRVEYDLHEKVGIKHFIEKTYCYSIVSTSIPHYIHDKSHFASYEEAELECLKKLIEIVKNK